jgi:hypothetical protein
MSADHIEKPGDTREGYDHHDARTGPLALWSGGVVAFLIVAIIAMYWLSTVTEDQQYAENVGKKFWEISQETKAREDEQLYHYGYIDKGKGIVRIPVERAMQLVAEEYAQGKVAYNTKSYPVKEETLGGAQGTGLIVTADNVVAAPTEAKK